MNRTNMLSAKTKTLIHWLELLSCTREPNSSNDLSKAMVTRSNDGWLFSLAVKIYWLTCPHPTGEYLRCVSISDSYLQLPAQADTGRKWWWLKSWISATDPEVQDLAASILVGIWEKNHKIISTTIPSLKYSKFCWVSSQDTPFFLSF